jgi:hypothetical protein
MLGTTVVRVLVTNNMMMILMILMTLMMSVGSRLFDSTTHTRIGKQKYQNQHNFWMVGGRVIDLPKLPGGLIACCLLMRKDATKRRSIVISFKMNYGRKRKGIPMDIMQSKERENLAEGLKFVE